jgi:adenine-specific DNA-methyltransferase
VTKVFVGGSRRITRLDGEVLRRLDRIVEKRLPVVIGDANGADKAVQRYLSERKFEAVEVFSADESPRNNVGGWPICVIRPGHARKDFDYYAAKDRAMAAAATVGLMLWDGQSRGTLMNVLRLADQRKPVVVYVQPRKGFLDVRSQGDLAALLSEVDRRLARQLQQDAVAEGLQPGLGDQPALGF